MIRAALLDVDGTLIDSNDAHARAWVEACRAIGVTVDFNRVRRLIGMGGDHIIPILIGAKAMSPEGQRLSDHHNRIFSRDFLSGLRPFPGARELVARFKSEGLKVAIATPADGEIMNEVLKRLRIQSLVDAVVTKADAVESKPSPDIVNVALQRLAIKPEQAIFVGDTPYDIEAAMKAGVRSVAVLCGGWSLESLRNAVAIYRDPADLLRDFQNSIFSQQPKATHDIPFPLG